LADTPLTCNSSLPNLVSGLIDCELTPTRDGSLGIPEKLVKFEFLLSSIKNSVLPFSSRLSSGVVA